MAGLKRELARFARKGIPPSRPVSAILILSMNKRLHIYYSGSVQGVGFRYTAERIATNLGLTGWVKNLENGRVEVLCEGKEPVLNEFVKKIDDIFKSYIRDADITWGEASGEFDNFDIHFY